MSIYPPELEWQEELKNKHIVWVRPIKPEDEPLITEFQTNLSDETVHFRYFGNKCLKLRSNRDHFVQICNVDYSKEMNFVMIGPNNKIIAECGLLKLPDGKTAEFGITVTDHWQGQGICGIMFKAITKLARIWNVDSIVGDTLQANSRMLGFCRKHRFMETFDTSEQVVKVILSLKDETSNILLIDHT